MDDNANDDFALGNGKPKVAKVVETTTLDFSNEEAVAKLHDFIFAKKRGRKTGETTQRVRYERVRGKIGEIHEIADDLAKRITELNRIAASIEVPRDQAEQIKYYGVFRTIAVETIRHLLSRLSEAQRKDEVAKLDPIIRDALNGSL